MRVRNVNAIVLSLVVDIIVISIKALSIWDKQLSGEWNLEVSPLTVGSLSVVCWALEVTLERLSETTCKLRTKLINLCKCNAHPTQNTPELD